MSKLSNAKQKLSSFFNAANDYLSTNYGGGIASGSRRASFSGKKGFIGGEFSYELFENDQKVLSRTFKSALRRSPVNVEEVRVALWKFCKEGIQP